MAQLKTQVDKVRSKNAGPFWVTIDIFCKDDGSFPRILQNLRTDTVATLYGVDPDQVKRFDIAELNVIKFSFPRPQVQGSRTDRDMHGAAFATLLEELELLS